MTLDTLPYHVVVDRLPRDHFRVHALTGREAMSEGYSFDIAATARAGDEIERIVLGQRAVLTWNVGGGQRAFYGVIAAARLAGADESTGTVKVQLRLVPRLWLLKRKRRTRIFQRMRVPDIVSSVLLEAGIATRWQLKRDHPVREYCTQYEESDHRFVQRLLAESAIYFYLAGGSALDADALTASAVGSALIPGDTVICADDAAFYPPIGGDGADLLAEVGATIDALAARPAPTLYYLPMVETHTPLVDKITRFALRTSVRSDHAHFRDYDPERPMLPLRSTAFSNEPFAPAPLQTAAASLAAEGAAEAAGALAPSALEVYDHHGPFLFPKWGFTGDEAARILRQTRRRAAVAAGESGCPLLSPAHRFTLSDHPASHLDRPYVVTSVEHRGQARPEEGGDHRLYACTFECVPAVVPYVPPRPKRRSVQVAVTATVVGPPGEEIHVDAMGQIKVQFHWDRQGKYDDRSSCWIRSMHPWAGAGWGAQFIPRVGMEVVVTFEGGDPDKPIVLGALYNGTHPSPFALPTDKSRSGFRTQAYPGGQGFNELSFEDAKGGEEVYLRAERDLRMLVRHDRWLNVGGSDSTSIGGSRSVDVRQNMSSTVQGDDSRVVGANASVVVAEDLSTTVGRNSELRVLSNATTTVIGTMQTDAGSNHVLRVGRASSHIVGEKDEEQRSLCETYVRGQVVTNGTKGVHLRSDESITLTCGETALTISPEGLVIEAKALTLIGEDIAVEGTKGPALRLGKNAEIVAPAVSLFSKSASIELETEASIKGAMVHLNKKSKDPSQGSDSRKTVPTKPLAVRLTDKDFKPYANKTWEMVVKGEKYTGVTGGDGALSQDVPADIPTVTLTVWIDQYPTGRRRAYAIDVCDELPDVHEIEGLLARLRNLGYYAGRVDLKKLDTPARDAMQWFQRDHEIEPTDEPTDETRAALASAHGH